MKKTLIAVLVMVLLILVGCQQTPIESIENESNGSEGSLIETWPEKSESDFPDINPEESLLGSRPENSEPGLSESVSDDAPQNQSPNESISVHSVEELDHMRSMLSCADEDELATYLRSVEGGGAHCKEDLAAFLKIVDSIPLVDLLENSKISWICHSIGESAVSGEQYEVLFISMEAKSGDWVRFEYILSVEEASKEAAEQIGKLSSKDVLAQPIFGIGKRIAIYSEQREKHVSGTGEIIKWISVIDGFYANIVYYSAEENATNANKITSLAEISTFAKME